MTRNITLIILVCFIAIIGMIGIGFIIDDGVYPDSHFGLTRFESFKMVTSFILIISTIPLIIDIILFVGSIIQIYKIKKLQLVKTI